MKTGISGDIYSLALILFEVFSGTDPFPGDFRTIFPAKISGRIPDMPPDFPIFLKPVVTAGMDADSKARPPVRDFKSALVKMKTLKFYEELIRQPSNIPSSAAFPGSGSWLTWHDPVKNGFNAFDQLKLARSESSRVGPTHWEQTGSLVAGSLATINESTVTGQTERSTSPPNEQEIQNQSNGSSSRDSTNVNQTEEQLKNNDLPKFAGKKS